MPRFFFQNAFQQIIDDLEFMIISRFVKNSGVFLRAATAMNQQRGVTTVVNDLIGPLPSGQVSAARCIPSTLQGFAFPSRTGIPAVAIAAAA